MKLFDKLFGKKKATLNSEPVKNPIQIKENEEFAVKFKVKSLIVDNAPFELMMNMSLLDSRTHEDYNWLWTVTIKSMENDVNGLPTENERKKLMQFMKEIVQEIMKETDIKIVGISLHKGIYDIMFYARKADSANVGGTIAEMPYSMEDVKGRFVKYNGLEDSNWEKVKGYYSFCNQ